MHLFVVAWFGVGLPCGNAWCRCLPWTDGGTYRFTLVDLVVKARWAAFVLSSVVAAAFAFYPQPRTSGLLWRVPYDNQSRAAGPVGIGHTPQQIASQYKEPLKALKQHVLLNKYGSI
jgi:hypothetical protein